MPVLLMTIRVADGSEVPSAEVLTDDLGALVHTAGAEHYGRSSGCHLRVFHRDGSAEHDRAAFRRSLQELGADEETQALHLSEWDQYLRPVAVMHWWEAVN
jgi:hypothetical protein